MDEGDIYDDVNEKKALPELILKQNILNAQDAMLISERKMMNNFRSTRKWYKQDLVEFEGNIILLFGFIKRMMLDQGIAKKDENGKPSTDYTIYKLLLQAERGKQFSGNHLVVFKNFLLKYLHKINITNLFTSRGSDFRHEIDSEF